MRLPSHVLRLCLASTAVIGCEQAHEADPVEPPTAVERSDESLADQFRVVPAVAPKYAPPPQQQPQPQHQPAPDPKPQPRMKPKPKPRFVESCGHWLPNTGQAVKKCGMG